MKQLIEWIDLYCIVAVRRAGLGHGVICLFMICVACVHGISADVSLQMALPAALEHGTIYCLISAGAYLHLWLARMLETTFKGTLNCRSLKWPVRCVIIDSILADILHEKNLWVPIGKSQLNCVQHCSICIWCLLTVNLLFQVILVI